MTPNHNIPTERLNGQGGPQQIRVINEKYRPNQIIREDSKIDFEEEVGGMSSLKQMFSFKALDVKLGDPGKNPFLQSQHSMGNIKSQQPEPGVPDN